MALKFVTSSAHISQKEWSKMWVEAKRETEALQTKKWEDKKEDEYV